MPDLDVRLTDTLRHVCPATVPHRLPPLGESGHPRDGMALRMSACDESVSSR